MIRTHDCIDSDLLLQRLPGLSPYDFVDHFVTTRRGGVSVPPYDTLNLGLHVGDDAGAVIENRRRLARAFGIPLDRFVFCQQVHGNSVATVTGEHAGWGSLDYSTALPAMDAMITDQPMVCLTLVVADCVPVLILDPIRRVVGVAHAGWRGTVRRITEKTIEAMESQYGSEPSDLLVAIGPSIGPESFEVGREVVSEVRDHLGDPDRHICTDLPGGNSLLNLWEMNRRQAANKGVLAEHIRVSGISTVVHRDSYFSFRAARGPTGRFAAGIVLKR